MKLPAAYDARASLQSAYRWQALLEEAFKGLVFQDRAKRQFIERCAAAKLDKLAILTAYLLADRAALTPANELELHEPLTPIAKFGGLSWDCFRDRLALLESAGLIEVLRRGAGAGRPYRIKLKYSADHIQEIVQRTADEIAHHLHIAEKRCAGSVALST